MRNRVFFLGFALLFSTSCLQQLGLKKRKDGAYPRESKLVKQLRRDNANLKAKVLDYEEQFRVSKGKIEELQIINKSLQSDAKRKIEVESQELKAYKDSVSELLADKKRLQKEALLLKEKNKEALKAASDAKKTSSDHLKIANVLFDKKKWAEAISEYQSYREKTKAKRSDDYALVTYKIGVCFQELGMMSEAKTFYKSVTSKFKKTRAAKFSDYRLTQLKNSKKKK